MKSNRKNPTKANRDKQIRKHNATVQATSIVRSTFTQTDVTSEAQVRTLQAEVKGQAVIIEELQRRIRRTKVNLQTLRENPNDVKYYTGLGSYAVVEKIFVKIEPFLLTSLNLNKDEVLLMTLQKLRHDATYKSLGIAFEISPTTSAKYFLSTIYTMFTVFHDVVHWPERETLKRHTPQCFRDSFGESITTIIDCFEIKGERPANPVAAAQQWSEYKKSCTVKYLIAISSSGYIMFVSNGFGGRASDKLITESCGFLEHIIEGDIVMGDRGFLIQNELQKKKATLCIPAFRKSGNQLLAVDTERTRNVANVRIHVERIIANLRNKFNIIKDRVPMTLVVRKHNGHMLMDMIVRVAAILVNLCPEIVN